MTTTSAHQENLNKTIIRHSIADVRLDTRTNHHSLHASVAFDAGDIIIDFCAATTQNYPTYLTVQIANDTHITLAPQFLQYINHRCDPNVYVPVF